MKKIIYYIIPILVLGATFLGRLYWGDFSLELLAFDWVYSSRPASPQSVLGTIIYVIPIILVLVYLIYMLCKNKRGIKYGLFLQILIVVALSFFIEVLINGIICMTFLFEKGGDMAAFYGFTYFFTLPVTLLVSYTLIGILNNDI